MRIARRIVHQISRLALLFALLGSRAALAAASAPAAAAAGDDAGATKVGPTINVQELTGRIYEMLAAYGLKIVGAL